MHCLLLIGLEGVWKPSWCVLGRLGGVSEASWRRVGACGMQFGAYSERLGDVLDIVSIFQASFSRLEGVLSWRFFRGVIAVFIQCRRLLGNDITFSAYF